MKRFNRESFELIVGLQLELSEATDASYAHRLHCVLLVLQGMSARQTGKLFGTPARSVQRWFEDFKVRGLSGLVESPRSGRTMRLSEEQLTELGLLLRSHPSDVGMDENLWDGKVLSAFILKSYGVSLGVRRCQKIFHQFGFRLRKPRPELGGANPGLQKAYKKTQKSPQKSTDRSLVPG